MKIRTANKLRIYIVKIVTARSVAWHNQIAIINLRRSTLPNIDVIAIGLCILIHNTIDKHCVGICQIGGTAFGIP